MLISAHSQGFLWRNYCSPNVIHLKALILKMGAFWLNGVTF